MTESGKAVDAVKQAQQYPGGAGEPNESHGAANSATDRLIRVLWGYLLQGGSSAARPIGAKGGRLWREAAQPFHVRRRIRSERRRQGFIPGFSCPSTLAGERADRSVAIPSQPSGQDREERADDTIRGRRARPRGAGPPFASRGARHGRRDDHDGDLHKRPQPRQSSPRTPG